MDRVFIVALLSAPVSWPGVAVTLTLAYGEFYSPENANRYWRSNLHTRLVVDEYILEIAGRVGDTPIHESLGEPAEMRTRQSLDIPSIGLDELRLATLREGRLRCANDREQGTV
jgi:hypothetical protein